MMREPYGRGRGGHGGMRGRGGRRSHGGNRSQYIQHVPFDMAQCDSAFPKVTTSIDDKGLVEALLNRNLELTPTAQEQSAVTGLVSKIQGVVDSLILTPDSFESAIIDEARTVGSFKKGTMLSGKTSADLVLILRTLPTCEAVTALGNRLMEDLTKRDPNEALSIIPHGEGFDIKSSDACVKCLITTIPPNMKKLDPEIHLPAKVMGEHLAAIRHSRWFEETATHSSIKVVIRLIKDLRNRFTGLLALSPWTIDLLAHHAIMSNPQRSPLPINQAFRRVLQLLSSGIFLPGSIGLLDPCELGGVRCHVKMTLEEMDVVCTTAQTLLRVLCHGGHRQILAMEGASDVATSTSLWDGVVVTPSTATYERPAPAGEGPEVTGTAPTVEDFEAEYGPSIPSLMS